MTHRFSGTHVLIVGRFDDQAHSHNALRRRAFERLGCTVTSVDLEFAGVLERLRRLSLTDRLARAIDKSRPQMVLVIGGEGLHAEQIASLRGRSSAIWVNWFPGEQGGLNVVRQIAAHYERVFVMGTDLVSELRAGGQDLVGYLPAACDPSVHRPMRARGPFRANVVFAGTASSRREQLLTGLVEFGLAVWGPGWRKTSLRDYCRGELPVAEDYVRACAGATVAVNIHQTPGSGDGSSRACNQRLFELAAIGTAQVVDARGDLPRHFTEGTEMLVFRSPEELRELVKRALDDNGRRERVASAARERALRDHTYMHRIGELLRAVKGEA